MQCVAKRTAAYSVASALKSSLVFFLLRLISLFDRHQRRRLSFVKFNSAAVTGHRGLALTVTASGPARDNVSGKQYSWEGRIENCLSIDEISC